MLKTLALKKKLTDENLASLKGLDIFGLHSFLRKKLSDINSLTELYSIVLGEMDYGTNKRLIPDYDDNIDVRKRPSKLEFVYNQEKNKPKVKELDSLFHQWKEIVKNHSWDYYHLSKT